MKKSLTVSEPHTLGTAPAVDRLKRFTGVLRRDWGGFVASVPTETWSGNVLTYKIVGVRGGTIEGTVTATDSAATIQANCDLPRLFVPWGVVETEMRSALRRALQGV